MINNLNELADFVNNHRTEVAVSLGAASITAYFAMKLSARLANATANENDPEELAIATYIWQLGLNTASVLITKPIISSLWRNGYRKSSAAVMGIPLGNSAACFFTYFSRQAMRSDEFANENSSQMNP